MAAAMTREELDAHYAKGAEILANDPKLTAEMTRTDDGKLAYYFITDPTFRKLVCDAVAEKVLPSADTVREDADRFLHYADPAANRDAYGFFEIHRKRPVLDRLEAEAARGERNGWTGYARRRRERVREINLHDGIARARLGDGSGVGEVAARKVVDLVSVHERGDEVESWYDRNAN